MKKHEEKLMKEQLDNSQHKDYSNVLYHWYGSPNSISKSFMVIAAIVSVILLVVGLIISL